MIGFEGPMTSTSPHPQIKIYCFQDVIAFVLSIAFFPASWGFPKLTFLIAIHRERLLEVQLDQKVITDFLFLLSFSSFSKIGIWHVKFAVSLLYMLQLGTNKLWLNLTKFNRISLVLHPQKSPGQYSKKTNRIRRSNFKQPGCHKPVNIYPSYVKFSGTSSKLTSTWPMW